MFFSIILTLAFYLAAASGCFFFVFEPLRPAFERGAGKRTLGTIDLLSAFIPLTLGFALVHWRLDETVVGPKLLAFAAVWVTLFVGFSTFYAMGLLWRLDLVRWWKRTLVISLLMPLGGLTSVLAMFIVLHGGDSSGTMHRAIGVAAVLMFCRSTSVYLYCNQDERPAAERR
ncbi:MAG: hypothetical protein AAF802_20360 [Planctomycetota bacterium]